MAKPRLTAKEKKEKALLEKKTNKPAPMMNPKTRRLAIHSFCHECIYDPGVSGGWRRQVEECTAPKCPLFGFRPMTIAAERARNARKGKK